MILKKMTRSDIPTVSGLIGNAFADKFTDETTLAKETAKTLMKLLWLEEAEMFGMQPYVIKDGEEIVAAFGLTLKQKKKLTLSFIAKVLAVLRKCGFRKLVTFAKVGLETNRTPAADEMHIDFITVKETRRNENIGHQVMEEVDAIKERENGIEKVSLFVLKDNEPAKHLYKKYGFRPDAAYEKTNYLFMMKRS